MGIGKLIKVMLKKERDYYSRMFGAVRSVYGIVGKFIVYPIAFVIITMFHYMFAAMHFLFETWLFFFNRRQYEYNIERIQRKI